MQDLPGAPGTARQGRTRTIVSTNRGGVATQPRAPGHGRPPAAQRAAGHGRLSAALRAPGADVPLAMTAGAPGQHCLSAALQAPGADRRLAITAGAPDHHRLSAAPRAPGADAPLATMAGAPDHHRLSATQPALGADAPLATMARAPGLYRLSAAPIATAPSPAGLRRLRQAVLPRVPANPRTLIYSPAHQDTALTRHRVPPRHQIRAIPRKQESTPLYMVERGRWRGTERGPPSLPAVEREATNYPPSASCRPSTAPPAVLLHRVYGLLATAPIARTPHCTGRGHISSPGACSGGGLGRGPPCQPP